MCAKEVTYYVCQHCSYKVTKWIGKCPECQQWNTFVLEQDDKDARSLSSLKNKKSDSQKPIKLNEVVIEEQCRFKTGIGEFDRVIGGGIVPGSLTLIGGEPGVGKSTLLLEVCRKLAHNYPKDAVLYISGEESVYQVADRSRRMGVNEENFYVYHENCWQNILQTLKEMRPHFVVLDSIQTTVSLEVASAPGTLSQIREITYELMNYAKIQQMSCFMIGHVTKDGVIAGPKVLEHMVDTVIYFEGDEFNYYRILRAIKNRFGNVNEVGIFEMKDEGLTEVLSPLDYFLTNHLKNSYGRALSSILEGSRPLLLEIQTLVVENKYGNGRRTTQGLDSSRLAMLVAIIEKYFQIPLGLNDIYVNIVGGIKQLPRETDLCILAGLISSLKQFPIPEDVIYMGEVGLTGEVRGVHKMEQRLRDLHKFKYRRIVMSERPAKEFKNQFPELELIGIGQANQLLQLAL